MYNVSKHPLPTYLEPYTILEVVKHVNWSNTIEHEFEALVRNGTILVVNGYFALREILMAP